MKLMCIALALSLGVHLAVFGVLHHLHVSGVEREVSRQQLLKERVALHVDSIHE